MQAVSTQSVQRRMLLIFLAILLVLYAAAVATTGFSADVRGEIAATVLCVAGLGLAARPPLRGVRYWAAVVCMCAAPIATMLFHQVDVAQVWALTPLMFAAVFVRAWHRPVVARAVAVVLSAAAAAALYVAPAPSPVLWYLIFLVCIIGAAEVVGVLHATLVDAALRDPLTGVWNRAGVDRAVGELTARAVRRGEPVAVIVLDVDDFKAINDRDGHGAGDQVLAQLTRRWTERLPASAVIGRLGGDEFVVVLCAVDEDRAAAVAAGLCGVGPVHVSCGVAVSSGGAFPDLLATADDELYRSKRRRKAGP
ncbi:diguanylate cyclase [Mycolicibacterium sp.]|uniref:GGDEF domain-containing protein n=1 Tax=Mycolicibacterium sp. TaxID=2320850 RepID=UPI003D13F6D1